MKDGSAHPNGPDWIYTGEDGTGTTFRDEVPAVKIYELGNDPEHRAATDLERIANRYRESLPAVDSAQAQEIEHAARCLYTELYRDCGSEARRQKLKGAWLVWRWAQKTIKARSKPTTEEIKRARAFMVLDIVEQGIEKRDACKIAEEVAAMRGLNLGKRQSFENAHDEYLTGADWLASGIGDDPLYWPVTGEDLDALDRLDRSPAPEEIAQRDSYLTEAAGMLPSHWPVSECVRQIRKKAGYLAQHSSDPDPDLPAILRLQGWRVPLFEALKTGAPLPSDNHLRELIKRARETVKP